MNSIRRRRRPVFDRRSLADVRQAFAERAYWYETSLDDQSALDGTRRASALLPPEAQQFCLSRELTEEGFAFGPSVELNEDGAIRLVPNDLRERTRAGKPVRGRWHLGYDDAGEPILGDEFVWTTIPYISEEVNALTELLALLELQRSLDLLPLWEDCFETSRDLESLIQKNRRGRRGIAAEAELRAAQDRLVAQLPSALQSPARTIRSRGKPRLSPARELVAQYMMDLRFSSALIEERLKLDARRVQELRARGRRFFPPTIEAIPRSLDEAGPWLEERINALLGQLRKPDGRVSHVDGKIEPPSQLPRLRG